MTSTTGQIPSNITLGASQAVRRNASDTGFEAYTPGAGSTGDVVGPAGATNDDVAIFDGTTGKAIKDSGVSISNLSQVGHDHAGVYYAVADSGSPVDYNIVFFSKGMLVDQGYNGSSFAEAAHTHSYGDVSGPLGSDHGNFATFAGATGKVIDDTGYNASSFASVSHGGLIPIGGIIMWSGTVATIPANWALCNGLNGTPDLRDRFIVGARQDDSGVAKTSLTGSLTQSGGSASFTPAGTNSAPTFTGSAMGNHNHGVTGVTIADHADHTHSVTSNVTVADHAAKDTGQASAGATQRGTTTSSLTLATHTHQVPAYTHSVTNNAVTSGTPSIKLSHSPNGNVDNASAGTPVGTVSAPAFTGTSATVVPPYYALAFIMRVS